MSKYKDPNYISTGQALAIIARSMRYTFRYKFELTVKALTQMTSIFWILLLPWPGKIIVDYIVLGANPKAASTTPLFFLQPLLNIVEPLAPYHVVWVMAAIFLLMLILIGAFGPEAAQRNASQLSLAEGSDTATRSENQANSMSSLVGGLFGLFEALWHIRITHRLNHRLRSELFKHFKASKITTYHNQSVGDVVFHGMYDTPAISNIIFNIWVGPATTAINMIMTLLMLFLYFRSEPAVVWCALAIAPVNFTALLYFAKLTRKYSTRARIAGAKTTAIIEEGMSNIMAVQGLGTDSVDREQFKAASEDSYRQYLWQSLVGHLGSAVQWTTGPFFSTLVAFLVSSAFIEGKYAPGDWWVIFGYYFSLAAAATYVGNMWLNMQDQVAGMQRVFNILDTEVEEVDKKADETSTFSMHDGVRLENVDYNYPDGTPALHDINFNGRLGELVALTGPTGAGKSTLAYLIPALLTPTRGCYILDGKPLSEYDLNTLRRQVAFVFQETSVFDDTVEGNILMGRTDATPEEVRSAAALAGAAEFIDTLPDGYQTRLGRSGGKLSVGQKQRLAIARALVSNKPILILDEPTAALDPQTENMLMANLLKAREGRLVIVIAHRLSTIRSADRIYFLEDGMIIESGNHTDLMAQKGKYGTFVNLQTQTSEEKA